MPRGLLFLLIYCGVLLTDRSCWARKRENDDDDGRRREGRRDRRRKEERRQRNKEQEMASSSLIEALESHSKYSAASNPPNPTQQSYSNQTTVVQSYVVNQYDHPKPGWYWLIFII